MNRRPWNGIGLSVAMHVGAVLVVVGLFTRDDWLPALVVDLRDDFVAGTAAVRSRVGGSAPDVAAPGSAPRRSWPSKRELSPATPPALEAPAPPAPAPTPPVIAVSPPPEPAPTPKLEAPGEPAAAAPAPTRESLPSAVRAAERPGAGAPPFEASGSVPKSLADAAAGDKPPPYGAQGSGGTPGSSTSGSGGSAPVSTDRPGTGAGGRSGQALVLATPGGGSGVGAEYGPYLTALRQRIAQSVRYPVSARRRGISGTVNVEILILPTGVVGDVQLLESSTHQVLDDAALATIRSLPRMPLPPDLPARPLRVRVPVVFQIQ